MLEQEERELYSRHLLLENVGEEGQLKLKQSRVLVIGAGGLGCPVLQYLTAAGVGTLGIADPDMVERSNLQRQVLFDQDAIGQPKAAEAKKRLERVNPYVQFQIHDEGITVNNALEIIHQYNIIVDCTDNYPTRYLVNDACVLLDKPLIYGALHKFEGQVAVFNCQGGATYRCLYPDYPTESSTANCSDVGVMGVLPGIVGTMQANEVLKLILNIGTSIKSQLLIFDSLSNQFNTYQLEKKYNAFYDELLANEVLNPSHYQFDCSAKDILTELIKRYEQIIDVREEQEINDPVPEIKNIPLSTLEERYVEIDPDKRTIVFCRSGVRSKEAIERIKTLIAIEKIEHLEGGIVNN